jgi:hypothetical protein
LLVRDGLFRLEAIEFQRRRLSGNVVMRPDPPLTAACLAYSFLVCGLAAAFTFVSVPLTVRANAPCAGRGAGYVEIAHPHFSSGTALRRAEIATADGTRVAVWAPGDYSERNVIRAPLTGATPRGSRSSYQCSVTYSLTSRPADAVIHRLLRGS